MRIFCNGVSRNHFSSISCYVFIVPVCTIRNSLYTHGRQMLWFTHIWQIINFRSKLFPIIRHFPLLVESIIFYKNILVHWCSLFSIFVIRTRSCKIDLKSDISQMIWSLVFLSKTRNKCNDEMYIHQFISALYMID